MRALTLAREIIELVQGAYDLNAEIEVEDMNQIGKSWKIQDVVTIVSDNAGGVPCIRLRIDLKEK